MTALRVSQLSPFVTNESMLYTSSVNNSSVFTTTTTTSEHESLISQLLSDSQQFIQKLTALIQSNTELKTTQRRLRLEEIYQNKLKQSRTQNEALKIKLSHTKTVQLLEFENEYLKIEDKQIEIVEEPKPKYILKSKYIGTDEKPVKQLKNPSKSIVKLIQEQKESKNASKTIQEQNTLEDMNYFDLKNINNVSKSQSELYICRSEIHQVSSQLQEYKEQNPRGLESQNQSFRQSTIISPRNLSYSKPISKYSQQRLQPVKNSPKQKINLYTVSKNINEQLVEQSQLEKSLTHEEKPIPTENDNPNDSQENVQQNQENEPEINLQ
ncbi:Hypothetical_protein [Hexamita inflata]|uniref:Hypothetical_protein n=1 Tax=Hexamita inflata TaxID=28002 RepID=A0AA86RGA6_9EUKA|nr:Hypothetical protein HINF_LOCUS54190 [Hexamita inflata]